MTIKFTIPGKPEPQLRPRASKQGKRIVVRDPEKSRNYKDYVAWIAKQYAPTKLLEGALGVKLHIYRPIPRKTTKKDRQAIQDGYIRPITKPDVTNYAKGIEDALNGIIYKDDSQIVDLQVKKYYSDTPKAVVEVTEVF